MPPCRPCRSNVTMNDTVTVTAIDGTTHDIIITITGTNDAAVIAGVDTGGVTEDGGALQVTTGTLTISDIDTGDELFTAGGSTGTFGSVTIDANGNWTYTLDNANAAVQALPLNATLNDTVTVSAIDGTIHDITITITGTNDAAVVAGVDTGGVTEDGGVAEIVSGTLTISDIDTGEELFTVGGASGTYGSVTIDAAGAWTYTLDNANAAVQALALNATLSDTVTVTAIDGTTHDITVTITGTNDAAVIAGVDTGGVTEDGGALQVTSGTLTISDVDTDEELFTADGNRHLWSLDDRVHRRIRALRQPDQRLSIQRRRRCTNHPDAERSNVGPASFAGWSALQAEATDTGFNVLWQGPNDAYSVWQTDAAGVYLTSAPSHRRPCPELEPIFAADLDSDGFIEGDVATPIACRHLWFIDHRRCNGNWTYTLDNANAAVQALPLNATLNDTVTVTAIDGTTHDIIVTITGTNDAAMIAGADTGNVTEDGGALQVTSGTLTISDIDTGEELFAAGSSIGTYGSVSIDAAGAWTYTLDNANAAVQALPLGATLNDTVTVTAIDGTTHDITVTITGTNDAAVIAGVDTGGVTEDGGALQVTTGTLTISDIDTGEELFTVGGATGTYGSLTIDCCRRVDLYARQCQCRRAGPAARRHHERRCHGICH